MKRGKEELKGVDELVCSDHSNERSSEERKVGNDQSKGIYVPQSVRLTESALTPHAAYSTNRDVQLADCELIMHRKI